MVTMRRRLTLSARLVLATIIITFIVVIFSSAASYIQLRKMVVTVSDGTLLSQATGLSADLNTHLNLFTDNARTLAKNSLIANTLIDDWGRDVYIKPFLAGLQRIAGFRFLLTIANFEGVPLVGNEIQMPNLAPAAWLRSIIEDAKGKAIFVSEDGEAYFIVAEPIIYANTGTAEGVLVYQVKISDWLGMPQIQRIPNETPWITSVTLKTSKADSVSTILHYGSHLESAPTAVVKVSIPTLGDADTIELILKAKRGFIQEPLNELLLTTTISGLVLLIIAAVLATFLVRSQVSKLVRLSNETDQLVSGDKKTIHFTVDGNDEVTDLANSFNNLVEDLRTAYRHLEVSSEERLKRSLEYGGIGVWEWDIASGNIQWSNLVWLLFDLAKQEQSS
ncbi:MAG: HAMP domain-containing protein, partial [Gammaproteobacteria bacterium]